MKVSFACLIAFATMATEVRAETLNVFAAASLTDALDEALHLCNEATGIESRGIYAGSGTIARQIVQGAPAAIYISASPRWMDWLEERQQIFEETRVDLLGNQLVLVASRDVVEEVGPMNYVLPPEAIASWPIAIADPETVPAGIYAKQAFIASGWWDQPGFQDALAPSANVREALAWVARGEAGFGVVYKTDADREPRVTIQMEFAADKHDPILYPAAVIADNDGPNARSLLTCLQGEKASEVFKRFGFKPLH